VEQGGFGLPVIQGEQDMAQAPGSHTSFHANRRFDHASPRSGSSKRVTPVMWGVIVIAIVALTVWFAIEM
jgi:hypothetical protein